MKSALILAAAALMLSACRERVPTPAELADLVRAEYSGERALETVAFLDLYVRWPGNRGFDASIDHVAERLEGAGYLREDLAPSGARLTYRIEEYPMAEPAWEPLSATVAIEGETAAVLDFATNRNMLAVNSFATPPGGVTAELVDAGSGTAEELDRARVRGRIVMADRSVGSLFREAVTNRGALGALGYDMPDYTRPETNRTSIQFSRVPRDTVAASWGISLSFDARERLRAAMARGPVRVNVKTDVAWTRPAVERTVVADVHGRDRPGERLVFSAHVQEPGANDNASGVGAQLEMARVAAALERAGTVRPRRTITFLWGLEIRSTARYVEQDSARAAGIRWGISLDMVGEDTGMTGGSFLIEKMPDPSAVWTRGDDRHTEWGSRALSKDDLVPHYLNDFVLNRALEHAATSGWVVGTNPYEGGSDHVPFLRAGIPGLLLWHFTDQFYHTDRDRIEMVSAGELRNVGVTALVSALTLASADGDAARRIVTEVLDAALVRLEGETELSRTQVEAGAPADAERDLLATWGAWYDGALAAVEDVEVTGASDSTLETIRVARGRLAAVVEAAVASIGD